ncbi:MAG: lysophospholipase [Saprospiraceae bacterium]|nr:lysophospholipase [Saprospiraceae bacterium]
MNSANQTFSLKDGIKLKTAHYTTNHAIANLIFLHGYTEHIGRYDWMFQTLNKSNINVFTYDHRGFGMSEGERGYINNFQQYVDDLNQYLQRLNKPELPTFLMGHSMGSLIGAHYLAGRFDHGFAGFISSAGAFKIDENISPFLRKISGIVARITPHLRTVSLNANALSRDPLEVVKYLTDPKVYHGGTKARLGHEMLEAMKAIQLSCYKITLPVLLLHGTEDKLADPLGSRMMYDKVKSEDKTLRLFPGLYHELMREPEKEEVMTAICDWINIKSKRDL